VLFQKAWADDEGGRDEETEGDFRLSNGSVLELLVDEVNGLSALLFLAQVHMRNLRGIDAITGADVGDIARDFPVPLPAVVVVGRCQPVVRLDIC